MGRKGVSKRKPKKSRPFSNADINGSSNVRANERPSVQSGLKDTGASLNRSGINPSIGMNKKHQKGN